MSSRPEHPTPVRRVRLPANPESKRGVVLGEGKPENQNHAIIFCHNEALQSIDMNQVWPVMAEPCFGCRPPLQPSDSHHMVSAARVLALSRHFIYGSAPAVLQRLG